MKKILLSLSIVASSLLASGQTNLMTDSPSSFLVKGTSTMHDWESKSTSISGGAVLTTNGEIKDCKLTIPVKTLKSGKSGLDDNMYKALKEPKFKEITFVQSGFEKSGNQNFIVGKLTISGTTNTIKVPVTLSKSGNGVTMKGSYKLKMTQFGVEPPSFMFGAMTTGDDLEIVFDVVLKTN